MKIKISNNDCDNPRSFTTSHTTYFFSFTRSRFFFIAYSILIATLALAGTKIRYPRSTGKDYYIAFPKAAYGNDDVGILINSPTKQNIAVTTPSGAKGFVDISQATYTQYYAGQFNIERIPGLREQEAARIQSPNPISIHGQYGVGGISGTFTALPVTSWGTEYYAIAPPEGTNIGYSGYPNIYSVPMITIIASHDGTLITVTPSASTSLEQAQGVPFTVTMQTGDVYNITTQGDPLSAVQQIEPCDADLTGTHIISNHPVGIIVSQSHTTWPCGGDNDCGDYTVEWLPPLSNWDSVYAIPSVRQGASAALSADALRLVAGYDGTAITIDDGNNIGSFSLNAGEFYDYPDSFPTVGGLVISGTHPFLPVQITKSQSGCQNNNVGTPQHWSLGMTMVTGVNQWSDVVPFSSAIGSQSVADVVFRYDQLAHIHLNGNPLRSLVSKIDLLPQGFATAAITINGGAYNELVCDSGAAIGGSIFGYGTRASEPGNGSTNSEQTPQAIKSFAHPISGNTTNTASGDVTPPTLSIQYQCGHWDITAHDITHGVPASGIYDIWLGITSTPDSSYNVVFTPAPIYNYGDTLTTCGIDVINIAQRAQASLNIRDGAGNEFDTLLTYYPEHIDATPSLLDLGAIRSLTSATGSVRLVNPNDDTIRISALRLSTDVTHHWKILAPKTSIGPIAVAPGKNIAITFEYDAPSTRIEELDNDTLFVTTCEEMPVAALVALPKWPEINTQCYDFGMLHIDTLSTIGGDTASSGNGVWVADIGNDSLHIAGITLSGSITPHDPAFPGTDYRLGTFYKIDIDNNIDSLAIPTEDAPWILAPQETAFVQVLAHPHHSGVRGAGNSWDSTTNNAYLIFNSDANGYLQDEACLTMIGIAPGNAGVHTYINIVPVHAELLPADPNPFTTLTNIHFSVGSESHVTLRITNILGETITTIINESRTAGTYVVPWDASGLPAGMYYCELMVAGKMMMQRIIKL